MVVNKSLFQSLQSNQNVAMSAQTSKTQQNNANMQHEITKKTVIQKPQKLFSDKIDNSYLPFVPKLRTKPNALRPLPGKYEFSNAQSFYNFKTTDSQRRTCFKRSKVKLGNLIQRCSKILIILCISKNMGAYLEKKFEYAEF